jgi:hypothetical protein
MYVEKQNTPLSNKALLFGSSVTIVDNIVCVGLPSIGEPGSVQIYDITSRNAVSTGNRLKPRDGHVNDGFGISCKISKKCNKLTLIVGSHRFCENGVHVGSAYIFESIDNGENWTEIIRFTPQVKGNNMFFGCSVDIQDDLVIVGAYGDSTHGSRIGSVYIYKRTNNTWKFMRTLVPTDINPIEKCISSLFGFSISVENKVIVVGAPGDSRENEKNRKHGNVYIYYSDSNWEGIVKSHIIENESLFGFSVVMKNNTLIVGSPGTSHGKNGNIITYDVSDFFDIDGGFMGCKSINHYGSIETKSKSARSLFGKCVSSDGCYVVVSSFGTTIANEHVGSVFLYKKHESNPIACLRDNIAKEMFGHAITICGDVILIGDPSADTVHVYSIKRMLASYINKWQKSSFIITPAVAFAIQIE